MSADEHVQPDSGNLVPGTMKAVLMRQFGTAWKLACFHLDGLSTEECLWRPAPVGLHVERSADGRWHGQWPSHEGYDLGPPSIAWLTWHICFWWSMVIDRSFGTGTLGREQVTWPGSADAVSDSIGALCSDWQGRIERLSDEELLATERTKWPFSGRPFGDVVGWVNLELTKNAAELGYVRFLYRARAVD